ncbi:MAG: hypothetical protein J7J70_01925, partial [Deltaproteobacteria bacterium]|nr:hypothetical protein [Candidatus Tharpellaceae bacterium]
MPKKPVSVEDPISTPSVDSRTGRTTTYSSTGTVTVTGCDAPIITYEDLIGKTEHERLLVMRTEYLAAKVSC